MIDLDDFVDAFLNSGLEEDVSLAISTPPVVVQGIFQSEFTLEQLDRMQLEAQSPSVWVKTSEITGVIQNTEVTIREKVYKVSIRKPDSQGFTLLILKD